jgi:hypothetical protein
MEADWEFEVGGEAPRIDAHWAGFVDLNRHPERAWELAETADFPALAGVLVKLNAAGSPVWTSKCDVWPVVDRADWDPDELDAPPGCTTHAFACYIDLLHTNSEEWSTQSTVADTCKGFCNRLRSVPLRCCRADLVIRQALDIRQSAMGADQMDFGITAYVTGCGGSAAQAARALGAALDTFADAIATASAPAKDGSKLQ